MKEESKYRVHAAFRAMGIVTLCIIPLGIPLVAEAEGIVPCTIIPHAWTRPFVKIAWILALYGLPLSAIFGAVFGCKHKPTIIRRIGSIFLTLIGLPLFLEVGVRHDFEELQASLERWDSAITDEVPFSIGYKAFRSFHPFPYEQYYRCIVFKSGKRVRTDIDMSCRREDIAVYEIGDGRYCIVDRFDYVFSRSRRAYIINPESETVESKYDYEMPLKKKFVGTWSSSGDFTFGGKEPSVLETIVRCP